MATPKEAAKQLIDHLPDEATWEEIMYELYVKRKIQEGLAAIAAGRIISHEDAKKKLFGNTR